MHLQKIDSNKYLVPSGVSPCVPKECSPLLELPITVMFSNSSVQARVPLRRKELILPRTLRKQMKSKLKTIVLLALRYAILTKSFKIVIGCKVDTFLKPYNMIRENHHKFRKKLFSLTNYFFFTAFTVTGKSVL